MYILLLLYVCSSYNDPALQRAIVTHNKPSIMKTRTNWTKCLPAGQTRHQDFGWGRPFQSRQTFSRAGNFFLGFLPTLEPYLPTLSPYLRLNLFLCLTAPPFSSIAILWTVCPCLDYSNIYPLVTPLLHGYGMKAYILFDRRLKYSWYESLFVISLL